MANAESVLESFKNSFYSEGTTDVDQVIVIGLVFLRRHDSK